MVLSFIGACLLWVGWFGFNAGSALSSGSLATSAFVATHFAAATAAIGWAAAEWIRNGKPSVLGAISGSVAGLVAITPAAGFVGPMSALLIGLIAGVFCYAMVARGEGPPRLRRLARRLWRARRGRNDWRAADRRLRQPARSIPYSKMRRATRCPSGMIDGNFRQLGNQAIGVLIAIVARRGGHVRHPARRQSHPRRARVGRRRSAGSRPDAARRGRLLLGSVDAVRANL